LPKKSIDVFTKPDTEPLLDPPDPDEVIVFGVATDVCVDDVTASLRGRAGAGRW
jgi:nicotinamidase-related amidase